MTEPKPERVRYTCGYAIEGPKVGRRVVAWRRYCRRPVKAQLDHCYQHGGPWVPYSPEPDPEPESSER